MASLRQVEQLIGPTRNRSCFEILQCPLSAPSGYMNYQIQAANNSCVHVQVYCDLEGTNCGRSYMYVSMTQAGATCSQELTQWAVILCGRNKWLLWNNVPVSITLKCVDSYMYRDINSDQLRPFITVSFPDSLLKVVDLHDSFSPPQQLYHGLGDLVSKKVWLTAMVVSRMYSSQNFLL